MSEKQEATPEEVYRAVLEGAGYEMLDKLKHAPLSFAKHLGATARERTEEIIEQRNELLAALHGLVDSLLPAFDFTGVRVMVSHEDKQAIHTAMLRARAALAKARTEGEAKCA